MTVRLRIFAVVPLLCAVVLPITGCGKKEEPKAAAQPPAAKSPAAQPAAARETNVAGVVAELVEFKRKDGVLTVQIRLRNAGAKPARFYVVQHRNYDAFYVIAEDKKYLVLRDEDQTPLMPAADGTGGILLTLEPEGTWLWWAKYPAPPAGVKKVIYVTPLTGPLDDVPVSDQ